MALVCSPGCEEPSLQTHPTRHLPSPRAPRLEEFSSTLRHTKACGSVYQGVGAWNVVDVSRQRSESGLPPHPSPRIKAGIL